MIISEQQKRVLVSVLEYTKVFNTKIDEYVGAIKQGIAIPEEFNNYLKESIPRINLALTLLKNLEKKLSEESAHDANKTKLLEHVREIYVHWKSTAQIIDALSKSDKILMAYEKFERLLDKNERIILNKEDTIIGTAKKV